MKPTTSTACLFDLLPPWVLIAASLLMQGPRFVEADQIGLYLAILDDLAEALPVPENYWQAWVFRRLIGWINRQKKAAAKLINMNVTFIGRLPIK